mmetsp:Transcript_24409/g.57883  ORF Transcript_24409/g.57883 Transcript_24409/m.57883 type:complete len:243 (-) Transcript_24409:759-1487(-)
MASSQNSLATPNSESKKMCMAIRSKPASSWSSVLNSHVWSLDSMSRCGPLCAQSGAVKCVPCGSETSAPRISTSTAFSYSLLLAISSLLMTFLLRACLAIRASLSRARSMSSSSVDRVSSSSSESEDSAEEQRSIKDCAFFSRPLNIFSSGRTIMTLSTRPRSKVISIMTSTMTTTSTTSMMAEIWLAPVKLKRIPALIPSLQAGRSVRQTGTSTNNWFRIRAGADTGESSRKLKPSSAKGA